MTVKQKHRGSKYSKGAFLNVYDFRPREWEANLRRLYNLPSMEHVEVWLEYLPVGDELSILRSMLSTTRALVHGPFLQTSLATNWDALREISVRRYSDAIQCADSIGAKVITLHAGTYPFFEPHERAFERIAGLFAKFLRPHDPIVAFENMPVRKGTVKECLGKLTDLGLLRNFIPDAKFTLDIGHCLQNGDDFKQFLLEFASTVVNIHLHDGKAGGRSHLPIGAGSLDLTALLGVLRRIGFSEHVSLETITPQDTEMSWMVWMDSEKQLVNRKRIYVSRS